MTDVSQPSEAEEIAAAKAIDPDSFLTREEARAADRCGCDSCEYERELGRAVARGTARAALSAAAQVRAGEGGHVEYLEMEMNAVRADAIKQCARIAEEFAAEEQATPAEPEEGISIDSLAGSEAAGLIIAQRLRILASSSNGTEKINMAISATEPDSGPSVLGNEE